MHFINGTVNFNILNSSSFGNQVASNIADKNGNLLLYGNYSTIYDKNNNILTQNSLGLSANYTESLILPSLKDSSTYYIFQSFIKTLSYTKVNIETNTILGRYDTVFLNNSGKNLYSLAATGSSNCSGIWLLTASNPEIYVIKIDTIEPFKKVNNAFRESFLGFQIFFSNSGKKLAFNNYDPITNETSVFIADFDQATGKIEIRKKILLSYDRSQECCSAYTFSMNEKFIYFLSNNSSSSARSVKQLNIETGEINIVKTQIHYRILNNAILDIKLGSDGNLYVINTNSWDGSSSIDAIYNADSTFPTCAYIDRLHLIISNGFNFAKFPNQVDNYYGRKFDFKITQTCIGDSVLFEGPKMADYDQYRWHFSDGYTSTLSGVKRKIDATQTVHLEYNLCDVYDTIQPKFDHLTKPISTLPKTPLIACGDTTFRYPFIGSDLRYQWSTGDTLSSFNLHAVDSIQSTLGSSQSFFVKVLVRNECNSLADSVAIQLITITSPIFTDSTICEGKKLLLGVEAPKAQFRWSTGDTSQYLAVSTTGTYILSSQNKCETRNDTFRIEVVEKPLVNLPSEVSICEGGSYQVAIAKQSQHTYQWSSGSVQANPIFKNAGSYRLKVSNSCYTTTDTLFLRVIPKIKTPFATDTVACTAVPFFLNAKNNGSEYTWSTEEQSQAILITSSGIYKVQIKNDCFSKEASVEVKFIDATGKFTNTNVFTPNGDGINESFQPILEPVAEYELTIFNRWGGLVHRSTNPTEAWTADNITDGVYFYAISFLNCANKRVENKGLVQVIR